MDTLKEMFSDFKDRITNPFVSSFVVSWMAWNYKVVAAIFFYKVKDYQAFITIVEGVTCESGLEYPIYCALGYTFVFQIFKAVIKIFNDLLLVLQNWLTFKFTKELPISVKEHRKLLEDYEKNAEAYIKVIASQEADKLESIRLKTLIDTTVAANQVNVSAWQEKYDNDIAEINKAHDKRIDEIREEEQKRVEKIEKDKNKEIGALSNEVATLKRTIGQLDASVTKQHEDIIAQNNKLNKTLEKVADFEERIDQFENWKLDTLILLPELETLIADPELTLKGSYAAEKNEFKHLLTNLRQLSNI